MKQGPWTGHQARIDGDGGEEVLLTLHADGDAYRWYAGDEDIELSGESVAAALSALRAAYRMPHWDMEEIHTVRAHVMEALTGGCCVTSAESGIPLSADAWQDADLPCGDFLGDTYPVPPDPEAIRRDCAACPADAGRYRPVHSIGLPDPADHDGRQVACCYIVWRTCRWQELRAEREEEMGRSPDLEWEAYEVYADPHNTRFIVADQDGDMLLIDDITEPWADAEDLLGILRARVESGPLEAWSRNPNLG